MVVEERVVNSQTMMMTKDNNNNNNYNSESYGGGRAARQKFGEQCNKGVSTTMKAIKDKNGANRNPSATVYVESSN